MCGRYTLHLTRLEALRELLGVQRSEIEAWAPRYNAAPGQALPVVRADRVLQAMRWGLVPAWAKDQATSRRPINARIETIADLPTFRDAFASRRCVVPVTGYYEWRVTPPKAPREPVWIHPRQPDAGEPPVMALAGIWDRWVSGDGEVLDSFAIATMEPSTELSAIHDRMPLELHGPDVARWLAPTPPAESERQALLTRSRRTDHLVVRDVPARVGSTAYDDPGCIEACDRARSQLGLFK